MPASDSLSSIQVPLAWEDLTFSAMKGVVLVLGATDTGKTTFARFLYHRLMAHHERLAFVDGDVGQAMLGPPTTMTLALSGPGDRRFPPAGPRFGVFVGDISPAGHMVPTVVGAHRLVRKARDQGATAIIFDTSGLVAESQGGGALKRALIDLLRAEVVIGLQRGSELEHLLVPLRRSRRTRVIDRPLAEAVKRRDVQTRREHRASQYRRTFEGASSLQVEWSRFAVIPSRSFTEHRLIALEDEAGFVRGLGIVTGADRTHCTVQLHTTLSSLEQIDMLHVGDLAVDPRTFQDRRV
ncbi:MAG: Clp1/GlmU family protein [Chloroflexota bacterium]|nr:Clp1/GlmU family protein [Chloroflexota bacterium]